MGLKKSSKPAKTRLNLLWNHARQALERYEGLTILADRPRAA